MLDNNDIIKLSEVFAIKDDIKNFATKEDVLEFKNEILEGQDEILKELKNMTEIKNQLNFNVWKMAVIVFGWAGHAAS